VSDIPADGIPAEEGHAEYVERLDGATGIVAGAAVALDVASTGTRALSRAIPATMPTRRFIFESILPP
tara:strand:- start:133 stop:336 length:204 start_codon:yes stop_codon:yes gene_type:complete